MKQPWLFLALLACPCLVQAQSADALRGGWVADEDGSRHIYSIVLRDGKVSGTYCRDCENIHNLAFIDDGAIDDDGLRFAVYHYPGDAEPYRERVSAVLVGEELRLEISRPGAGWRELVVHRTQIEDIVEVPPADPTPNLQPGADPGARRRVSPGEPEAVTRERVVGLWLWGSGPGKQYFFFREHKDGLRGMVCGPCDSAADMAPLENVRLDGTELYFDIVHEDNGLDFEEHGPHDNRTVAQISKHEMHMSVVPSFEGPDFDPIEMTLLGPVETD